MPSYLIGTMTVHNPTIYKQYTALTTTLVERYGGRFLTRGGPVTTLEGDAFTERMVIIEFPSREVLDAWYKDPEYEVAAGLRKQSAVARVLVQDGSVDFVRDGESV